MDQRQKIREAQTQDLFYRSMHQWHETAPFRKKIQSASNKRVPSIVSLK
jgi:hypothetical protein